MNTPISVLIVDDHQMFREGVRKRLEEEPDISVVGEAASAEAALEFLDNSEPTIVLLDIRLPNMSGIEAARLIRKKSPDLKILVLTGYEFDQYVRALARAGIQGYILKDSPQEELVHAMREIVAGGTVLSPTVASKLVREFTSSGGGERQRRTWQLTLRELEVLEMLYEGLRNTQIAERLSISPRTVEAHVGSIISKLGAQTRTEAVQIALENDLIK